MSTLKGLIILSIVVISIALYQVEILFRYFERLYSALREHSGE
jgi:hypothetical protein